MTVRDPYTGVETKVRPQPQSLLRRWWPAIAIAVVAIVVGYFEWHNAQTPHAPSAASANKPTVASIATTAAPTIVASASATAQMPNTDELAQATAALAKASDQLAGTSNLLIAIAVLQGSSSSVSFIFSAGNAAPNGTSLGSYRGLESEAGARIGLPGCTATFHGKQTIPRGN
jgi:hypothetical protein